MQKAEMETRMAELRMAEAVNEDLLVTGYPVVYDSPTVIFEYEGIKYSEMIKRGALDGADMSDVPFKYNHSSDVMVMARTRNRTLSLVIDEKGLRMTANLARTTAGRDLYELIRRKDIDKMSFAFAVEKDSYDVQTRTRVIEKIRRIGDVSAVDSPAYDKATISVRDYFGARVEMEKKLKEDFELRKRRLLIATYL